MKAQEEQISWTVIVLVSWGHIKKELLLWWQRFGERFGFISSCSLPIITSLPLKVWQESSNKLWFYLIKYIYSFCTVLVGWLFGFSYYGMQLGVEKSSRCHISNTSIYLSSLYFKTLRLRHKLEAHNFREILWL